MWHHERLASKLKHEIWDELKIFLVFLICKCWEISFPTLWMDSHLGQKLVAQTFWQSNFFLCSTTLHLLLRNSPFVETSPQNPLYCLCGLSKLALSISHKCCFSSSNCVTIDTSSLASLGGCPSATQVVGIIGDLPVTIWKGVESIAECYEML